jgi:hypothetical protein
MAGIYYLTALSSISTITSCTASRIAKLSRNEDQAGSSARTMKADWLMGLRAAAVLY